MSVASDLWLCSFTTEFAFHLPLLLISRFLCWNSIVMTLNTPLMNKTTKTLWLFGCVNWVLWTFNLFVMLLICNVCCVCCHTTLLSKADFEFLEKWKLSSKRNIHSIDSRIIDCSLLMVCNNFEKKNHVG